MSREAPTTMSETKRIAAIATVYKQASHANAFIGKYLQGYFKNDKPPRPNSRLVSIYTDQRPADDLSVSMGKRYQVPVCSSIYEALTLGTGRLAVDGVLLVGEHGEYPWNEKEQHLYPRYRLFLEITDVFREMRKSVPLFNDKHFSYSWPQAKRMYDLSKELGFAFMAGSSLPVNIRRPAVDVPWGATVPHAVSVAMGPRDSYGFHMLETIQCLVERRKGGETGVASVVCFENEECWKFLDATPWARTLAEAAMARSISRKPGDYRQITRKPAVYVVKYRDGLEAAGFLFDGAVGDFTFAVEVQGASEPVAAHIWQSNPHNLHFTCLLRAIDEMFSTGKPAYPVERTLLVTGALEAAMTSRYEKGKVVATPHLGIRYRAPNRSLFCRAEDPEVTIPPGLA